MLSEKCTKIKWYLFFSHTDGSLKTISCYCMTEKRQARVISHEDKLEMIVGQLPKECLIAFRFSDSILFLENNHNWVDKNYLFWKECNPLWALPESPEIHGCLESSGRTPSLQIQRSAHNFNDFSDVLSIAENLQSVIRVLANTEAELTALGFISRSKFAISTFFTLRFFLWEVLFEKITGDLTEEIVVVVAIIIVFC